MPDDRSNRGFHPILENDIPQLVVDACVQIWQDADLASAHRHGITAYAVTAWMPWDDLDEALEALMSWHLKARQFENVAIATTAADIRRAKRDSQAALIIASQGGSFIGNKLHRVEAFWRLGLRMMILAYNASNTLADGVLDRTDGGLTALGVRVVEECNRLGLLLDLAHTGHRATLEVMERCNAPVVFSHANASALVDNPRNIDDQQIRACAATGGVVGVCPWGPLLHHRGSASRPNVHDLLAHVDHIAQITGSANSIGIGTDFSLGSYPIHAPELWGAPAYRDCMQEYGSRFGTNSRSPARFADGYSNYAETLDFIALLEGRGYSEQDVRGILGENFLRVFEQVWGG